MMIYEKSDVHEGMFRSLDGDLVTYEKSCRVIGGDTSTLSAFFFDGKEAFPLKKIAEWRKVQGFFRYPGDNGKRVKDYRLYCFNGHKYLTLASYCQSYGDNPSFDRQLFLEGSPDFERGTAKIKERGGDKQ